MDFSNQTETFKRNAEKSQIKNHLNRSWNIFNKLIEPYHIGTGNKNASLPLSVVK